MQVAGSTEVLIKFYQYGYIYLTLISTGFANTEEIWDG